MPAHVPDAFVRWRPSSPTIPRGPVREVGLVLLAVLVYFGVRNLTVGSPQTAFANADRVLALEQALSLDREAALQGPVVSHDWLVAVANWVYIYGHWPVILSAAVALYVLRRRHYFLLRNAMFVSGMIGFLFFALFPVAPPRLLGLGLVDTVTDRSSSYRALQPPGLTNQYAALPSLHAGWNLLVGIVLFLAFANVVVRAAAIVLPCAMAVAVVVTANHFVVDVAAGVAVVLSALLVSISVERRSAPSTMGPSGVTSRRRDARRPP